MATIEFQSVDLVFGDKADQALAMLDAGADRAAVMAKTGAVIAVHDANLAVEEGEICVLMGLSGSGKSSLLRCVNGLNQASRGRVLVADSGGTVDVARCDATTLRRLRTNRIAMVFQQFALLPWRTVAGNVGLGLELRGADRADRERIVAEKLKLVHLDQWADKYAHELSGGMQQRVGLARAFATDADILLMDEPFSALDPLIREHLQDELLDLQRALRKTIVFVSHDLDEALKIGTHIAIMQDGRIVQYGRPEEIVTSPATDYVRAFVANVNPLNVLRCRGVMRAAADLARDPLNPDTIWLDPAGTCRVRIGSAGLPDRWLYGDAPRACVALSSGEPGATLAAALGDGAYVAGAPETPIRDAIEVSHATGRPMPVLDAEGRLLGVVGERELIAAMLRRSAPSR